MTVLKISQIIEYLEQVKRHLGDIDACGAWLSEDSTQINVADNCDFNMQVAEDFEGNHVIVVMSGTNVFLKNAKQKPKPNLSLVK